MGVEADRLDLPPSILAARRRDAQAMSNGTRGSREAARQAALARLSRRLWPPPGLAIHAGQELRRP